MQPELEVNDINLTGEAFVSAGSMTCKGQLFKYTLIVPQPPPFNERTVFRFN